MVEFLLHDIYLFECRYGIWMEQIWVSIHKLSYCSPTNEKIL
jgi:hypothetical protein